MDDRAEPAPQDAAAPEYPMIRILQGEDRRLRSGSPWLYSNELKIDEAARVSDELYRAVRPMLATSGGRIVLLSTPFGKRGFFFRATNFSIKTFSSIIKLQCFCCFKSLKSIKTF